MKYIFLFIFCSLSIIGSLFSQETKIVKLGDFKDITFTGKFVVQMSYQENPQAEIVLGDVEVELDKIQFNYSGDELNVKYLGSIIGDKEIDILIRVPSIEKITVKSGSEVRVLESLKLNNENLELEVSTGGKIRAHVQTESLSTKITSGGSIHVTGNTNLFEAKIRTGGTIEAKKLTANEIIAQVNLGGEINCFANEKLDAKVSGGGTINYAGDAKVEESVKMGGAIEKIKK